MLPCRCLCLSLIFVDQPSLRLLSRMRAWKWTIMRTHHRPSFSPNKTIMHSYFIVWTQRIISHKVVHWFKFLYFPFSYWGKTNSNSYIGAIGAVTSSPDGCFVCRWRRQMKILHSAPTYLPRWTSWWLWSILFLVSDDIKINKRSPLSAHL